jgi:hypothetical protein
MRILPGFWLRLRYRIARLFRRRPPLDLVIEELATCLHRDLRRLITDSLMTLSMVDGLVLRLGQDLDRPFPDALRQLVHAPLLTLLARDAGVGHAAGTVGFRAVPPDRARVSEGWMRLKPRKVDS